MKLLDLLADEAIQTDLQPADKKGILRELSHPVALAAGIEPEKLLKVLLEREQLGSTGIGSGIAIPHGKLPEIETLFLGFGLCRQGVDFESIDNQPARLFFMLVTPENSTGLHLKVLSRISRILKNEPFRESLEASTSRQEIRDIIEAYDEEF
jgi:PTS system nitrogen regulatory IIA component